MDPKKFLNVELLYHADLKNKFLVKVPLTPYHVLLTYVKTHDTWNATLVEMLSKKRKLLSKGLSSTEVSKLVLFVMTNGSIRMKSEPSFSMLIRTLHTKIKELHKNG